MKKYFFIAVTLFLAISLQSCLKDKGYDNYEYGLRQGTNGTPAVGFPLGSGTRDTAIVAGSISPSATAFNSTDVIFVDLENTAPLSTATTVNITLNAGLLANTGLTPFPAGAVTIPSTVTIPAGRLSAAVPITFVNSSLLSLTTTYGIGISITGASNGVVVVPANKNVVAQYNVKNIYDGIYSVESGLVTRYTAPGVVENPSTLNGSLGGNPDVILTTTGAYSVSIPPSGQPGALQWRFGSGSGVAGVDGITLTVNPTTNQVTAVSAGNATFGNWAGHQNDYDPVNKVFHLSFRWNPSANVREYEIVLKYKSPRP